jgi:hypothetical protein
MLYDMNEPDQGKNEVNMTVYQVESMSYNTKGEGGMPKNGAQKFFSAFSALPARKFVSKFKKYSGILEDH